MNIKSTILRTSYWINDWLHGSPVRSHYLDIKQIQEDYTKGTILRKKHLYDILNHAVMNSNFYKGCNPNDLYSFPVVNKNILRDNYDNIKVAYDKIPGQNTYSAH